MRPEELKPIWSVIINSAKKEIKDDIYLNILENYVDPTSIKNNTIFASTKFQFAYTNIENNNYKYLSILEEIANKLLNPHNTQPIKINFVFEDENNDNLNIITEEKVDYKTNDQKPAISINIAEELDKFSGITPEYSSTDNNEIITQEYLDSLYNNPLIIEKNTDKTEQSTLFESNPDNTFEYNDVDSLVQSYHNNCRLNEHYTFDNFIIGNSNRIAVAAAKNVATNSESSYNPLFIYGNSGLGKTHLMHAIGHEILRRHPETKIICVSSEKFLNDLVYSIQHGTSKTFREMYRNIDVLLIDDIQFIQSKSTTQMEFFHTFNELYDDNKKIILTSDVLPNDMSGLEERLRSRFSSGYVASIEPPDLEMRLAILRSRRDEALQRNHKLNIPDDIIMLVATNIKNNIRSMEGTFNTIINTYELSDGAVNEAQIVKMVQQIVGSNISRQLSIDIIQESVSEYFHIKKEDLLGQKRKKHLVYPRQIAMFLCRTLIKSSFPTIAESFGKKDHTTILHAYDKIENEIKKSDETRNHVENLKKKIQEKCN